jgi:uncharacterized protein YecA (UPF0149 family)
MRKLSEIVLEMIEPMYSDLSEVEPLAKLAALGWNSAIVEQVGKPELTTEVFEKISSYSNIEGSDQMLEAIEHYKANKLMYYKNDNRMIVDIIFKKTFDGIHLDIVSSLVDFPEKKKMKRNEPCPCGSGKKYKKCCI